MTVVSQLGYWGFEVSDLEAWQLFASDILGFAVARREGSESLRLRFDEHAWRIALEPGAADDLAYVGWEVADDRALDALGERLAASGVDVEEGKPELREERQVRGLLVCEDPTGISTELYWGARMADRNFCSPTVASGFVAGEQGAGHMVISAPKPEATYAFYTELLGLRVTDFIDVDIGSTELHLTFLHANARHHTVAFSNFPFEKRINHFMVEARSFDEVGAAHDRCLDAGVPIVMGLGRHSNDKMFSFYARTPSGFDV